MFLISCFFIKTYPHLTNYLERELRSTDIKVLLLESLCPGPHLLRILSFVLYLSFRYCMSKKCIAMGSYVKESRRTEPRFGLVMSSTRGKCCWNILFDGNEQTEENHIKSLAILTFLTVVISPQNKSRGGDDDDDPHDSTFFLDSVMRGSRTYSGH